MVRTGQGGRLRSCSVLPHFAGGFRLAPFRSHGPLERDALASARANHPGERTIRYPKQMAPSPSTGRASRTSPTILSIRTAKNTRPCARSRMRHTAYARATTLFSPRPGRGRKLAGGKRLPEAVSRVLFVQNCGAAVFFCCLASLCSLPRG